VTESHKIELGDNRPTTFSPFLLRFFTVNYALRLNLTILRLNKHPTGRTGNANLLIGGKISIGAQVTESHKIESPPPCFMVLFTVNYALRLNLNILRLNKHRFFQNSFVQKGTYRD
jgi:hypothetical protein